MSKKRSNKSEPGKQAPLFEQSKAEGDFYDQLSKAKGDRSIGQYSNDAGISAVTYSRILHRVCKPSLLTLAKLTSEAARPQNGITYDILVKSAAIDGLIEITPVAKEGISPATAKLATDTFFMSTAMVVLQEEYLKKGCSVRVLPEQSLMVDDNMVKAHFYFKGLKGPEDLSLLKSFRELLGELVLLEPDSKRSDVILTNDEAYYELVVSYKNKLSYKGNLRIILINFTRDAYSTESMVINEDCISAYEG